MRSCTPRNCAAWRRYSVGGAQAIAALAFGTESVPKVDKIFGPGNAWVTEAKRQVSQRLDGAAIDMPAGPSEVLVIADEEATPAFVASDLLSQAEHGPDSQVILLTPSRQLAQAVAEAVEAQLAQLPRAETARQALASSRLIVARDLQQCVEISNRYGPEHLIIQTRQPRELVEQITSAGSVFSATGRRNRRATTPPAPTMCCRPTAIPPPAPARGWRISEAHDGAGTDAAGLPEPAPTIETLAAAEQLIAHKNAVTLRVAALKEKV